MLDVDKAFQHAHPACSHDPACGSACNCSDLTCATWTFMQHWDEFSSKVSLTGHVLFRPSYMWWTAVTQSALAPLRRNFTQFWMRRSCGTHSFWSTPTSRHAPYFVLSKQQSLVLLTLCDVSGQAGMLFTEGAEESLQLMHTCRRARQPPTAKCSQDALCKSRLHSGTRQPMLTVPGINAGPSGGAERCCGGGGPQPAQHQEQGLGDLQDLCHQGRGAV